ncbi:MAG: ATP-binding cassette domain-containing protein [Actinobacteria bacterium]|nr:ATP-binding cassette domain-containing protein [Actinomycetota bacterium]
MSTIAKLTDVSVNRGKTQILKNINWQMRTNEKWAVLGPNGAGKTTFLQLLSGYIFPASGTAEVLGEQFGISDITEIRSRIGLATANMLNRIGFDESVHDAVISAVHGVTGIGLERYADLDEERANELLEEWLLTPLANKRIANISDGERKRLLIARALMPNPELLLLDEPTAALDLGSREALLNKLQSLCRKADAPAIVMVTHHVEEIPAGITHILLLRAGKAIASGPVEQVISSVTLSATYGVPVMVHRSGERWFATARVK